MASAQPISHLKDPAGRYSVIPMWIRLQCIFNTMFYAQVWNYKLRRCLFTLLGHLDYIRTTFFHHVSSGQDHPYMSMKLCVSMSTLAVLDSLSLCAGLPLDSECFRWPDHSHLELAVKDLCLVRTHILCRHIEKGFLVTHNYYTFFLLPL